MDDKGRWRSRTGLHWGGSGGRGCQWRDGRLDKCMTGQVGDERWKMIKEGGRAGRDCSGVDQVEGDDSGQMDKCMIR